MELVTPHHPPAAECARREARVWRVLRACATVWMIAGWVAALAEPTETDVKAAFAFNFLRYTDWPRTALDGAEAPLVIGVSGAPEILERLAALAEGQRIGEHRVVVRSVRADDPPAGLHALYLGGADPSIPSALRGRAVLTVSDSPDFIRRGGMIGLLVVDRRVRFEINRGAVRRARLQLSAQLLSLATVVAEPEAQP